MPEPVVTFLIPTHARRDTLRRLLTRLETLPGPAREVVVVDDGSRDGTAAMLNDFPGVKVCRHDAPRGFDGLGDALRHVTGDLVFELDDDAYPHEDTLPKVVAHFERRGEKLGMVALPFVEPVSGRTAYTPYLPEVRAGHSYAPARGFFAGAVVFRRAVLSQVPLSPPGYFMYATEIPTTIEVLAHGWAADFLPNAPVYHLYQARASIKPHQAYLPFRNDLVTIMRYFRGVERLEMLAGRYLAGFFHLAAAGRPQDIFRVGRDARGLAAKLGRRDVSEATRARVYPAFAGTTLRTFFSEANRRRVAYALGKLPIDQVG